jgi:hypothetical protein
VIAGVVATVAGVCGLPALAHPAVLVMHVWGANAAMMWPPDSRCC